MAVPAAEFVQAEPHEGQPATELTEVRHRLRSRRALHRRRLPRRDAGQPDRQRHPQGLRRRRAGHLRGHPRHVRRPPQRLRLRRPTPRARSPTRRSPTKDATSTRAGTRCGRWRRSATPAAGRRRLRIPFKTLRFERGADRIWGVNFSRRIRRQERSRLLVAGAARLQPVSRRAGRHADRAARRQPGTQPADQAVDRAPTRRAASAATEFDADVHAGLDVEVRRDAVADARRHREARLRAGRGRRAAGQPDAVQPVLPREARVLSRELRHVLLRRHPARVAARQRAVRAAGRGDAAVLLAPHRPDRRPARRFRLPPAAG